LTSAGSVLPPEDLELFSERLHGWTNVQRPEDEMEGYLLASAVVSTVRMDRCARKEFAEIAKKRRKSMSLWDRRQDRKIDQTTSGLTDDPQATLSALRKFAAGCDWLIEQWEGLETSLQQGSWSTEQATQTILLLDQDDPATRLDALALRPEIDADAIDACLKTDTRGLEPEARLQAAKAKLPDPAAAKARWLSRISQEIRTLVRQRDDFWYREDGPALAETINLATFDASPEGTLYRRYEHGSSTRMHRCLSELREHRKLRDRDRKSGNPPPGWSDSEMAQQMVARAVQGLRPEGPVEKTSDPEEVRAGVSQLSAEVPLPNEPNSAYAPTAVNDSPACSSVKPTVPADTVPTAPMTMNPASPGSPAAPPPATEPRPQTPEEWQEEARRRGQII
jgi:hypothetical protein